MIVRSDKENSSYSRCHSFPIYFSQRGFSFFFFFFSLPNARSGQLVKNTRNNQTSLFKDLILQEATLNNEKGSHPPTPRSQGTKGFPVGAGKLLRNDLLEEV